MIYGQKFIQLSSEKGDAHLPENLTKLHKLRMGGSFAMHLRKSFPGTS